MCDASNFAVGAILGQRVDKKLNVIQYASKTLDAAQKNYATIEKEFLAVVFACDKFRPYIVDSKVNIHTDHAAIKYLMAKKDAKPRVRRYGTRAPWSLFFKFNKNRHFKVLKNSEKNP
jgi:hypothetical protein